MSSEHITIDRWGKDHWQMLFQLRHNEVRDGKLPRRFMRTGTHHALYGDNKTIVSDDYPTRLKVGVLSNHDDWDCMEDIIAEGLADYCTGKTPQGYDVPRVNLTSDAHELLDRLEAYMSAGNHYTDFIISEQEYSALSESAS